MIANNLSFDFMVRFSLPLVAVGNRNDVGAAGDCVSRPEVTSFSRAAARADSSRAKFDTGSWSGEWGAPFSEASIASTRLEASSTC